MRLRYHGIPWIRPAADQQIRNFFMKFGKARNIKKGEKIFESKEIYPNLSLIMSGLVSKYCDYITLQNTTKNKALSILLPFSLIGDTFFMSNRDSNVAASALRNAVLMEVPHDVVWEYMYGNQSFGRHLIYHIMYDLESDLEGFANIVARSPRDRILCLFKGLIHRCNVQDEDGWYKLPLKLTHSEIAQIVYVTPLTINRTLLEFKNENYYRKEKGNRYISKALLDRLYDWETNDDSNKDVIGKPISKQI